jgi:protein-disulfide isomerase
MSFTDSPWDPRSMAQHTSAGAGPGSPRHRSGRQDAQVAGQVPGTGSSPWTPRLALPVTPRRDHIRGPVDAPLTLLEYGDFECPYCGMASVVVEQVINEMGDQLRYVFRNFPLLQLHPHAQRAAEAAEAANAQGQYWPMHYTLFDHQQALEDPDLLTYAQALGMDVDQVANDLETGTYQPRLREDLVSGINSGVSGTPTFFINEARHDGSWDAASLLTALRAAAARRRHA